MRATLEFIGICETWLMEYIDNQHVDISGYNFYRADRTAESGKPSRGSLILYYKNNLKVHLQEELVKCNRDIEIMWVRLELIRTKLFKNMDYSGV